MELKLCSAYKGLYESPQIVGYKKVPLNYDKFRGTFVCGSSADKSYEKKYSTETSST